MGETHDGDSPNDSIVVGELTSGSLHSLNNLLQGIIGLSEVLISHPSLPEDARRNANVILRIAGDASELMKMMREPTQARPAPAIKEVKVQGAVAESMTPTQKKRSAVRILVVEDDPLVLNVVVAMLKVLGYATVSARDGVEGLERFREYRDSISVVLSDLAMPRMTGLQLAEEVLTEKPDAKIVIMTGYLKEELELRPDEFGLRDWLEKPMTAGRLEQVMVSTAGV